MKKIVVVIILIMALLSAMFVFSLSSERLFFYKDNKPSIGFTAEHEEITKVDIDRQYILDIDGQNGSIKLMRWDKDYLEVNGKSKIKGPSSRDSLIDMLEENKMKVESSVVEVKIGRESDEELKLLHRRTDDIVISVPEGIRTVNINFKGGAISIKGFNDMAKIGLEIENGSVMAEDCTSNAVYITVANGEIKASNINSPGTYECGRGDILLSNIKGNTDIKSVSGKTLVEKFEGKLNGNVSAGSITVKESRLKADSMIYASYGDIEAGLQNTDDVSGKYVFKAANGDITLYMPQKTGWSLLAKSTKGRVINDADTETDELETSPSGELYGDVRGGGAYIDIYVDNGDIFLK